MFDHSGGEGLPDHGCSFQNEYTFPTIVNREKRYTARSCSALLGFARMSLMKVSIRVLCYLRAGAGTGTLLQSFLALHSKKPLEGNRHAPFCSRNPFYRGYFIEAVLTDKRLNRKCRVSRTLPSQRWRASSRISLLN